MYRSPQQQLGADCYCCVKLHQDTWQLCSQADHLTSHMLHIQETSEGPNTRTSQVVGCFFFNSNTVQKRQCECKNCSKANRGSHIWRYLTCSTSNETSAPFQFKHILWCTITNTATQYVWDSVFYINSGIMVCCNAKLHWIRFHGNIHCQYNILNNSNSHLYFFFSKKSNLSHYGCSSTSPFLLFTHFIFQQVLLVISWGAALYPLSGAAQSWPVCHEIPSLYPADCTKSPYLTGSLL